MKEFEKWLSLMNEGWVKDVNGDLWALFRVSYTRDEKDAAMDGWQAALKWVLTHKKHIKYKDHEFDWVKTDVIEQELQDDVVPLEERQNE